MLDLVSDSYFYFLLSLRETECINVLITIKNNCDSLIESSFFCFQEHKVLLTGTPLQNTVEELFSLLHFLEPAQFPSEIEFLREFGDLKTEEQVGKTWKHFGK